MLQDGSSVKIGKRRLVMNNICLDKVTVVTRASLGQI